MYNDVIPTYYARFRKKVMDGVIPVCEMISLEMNRIDKLIADPEVYYDPKAVEGIMAFAEGETTLTDGGDLLLLDSFKLWLEQLFGWYYYVDQHVYVPDGQGGGETVVKRVRKRLVSKQYLIVARGAAKSMYASIIQNYILSVSTATTHQVTTAPTMKQSEEVMAPIRTSIIRARGPLFKLLTEGSMQNTTGSKRNRPMLASTKNGIENFLTGSKLEIRPMAINKLQGLRPFISTVDEWLSGDTREDVIGALEQGASKLPDYIIVAVSSEGTVRNAAGDNMKMELINILRGEYVNPHVSIFYYQLDDVKEVADPAMWVKAQPNLGITVSYDAYHRDVERAEKVPSVRNDILAKRFGLPMEGYTYFFTYAETLPHRVASYDDMQCSLGADLSQGDDFCAFIFQFPLTDGSFGNVARCYITEATLHKLRPAMRTKYDEFLNEESLVVMPGVVLNIADDVSKVPSVYDDLIDFMHERRYDVRTFGYDPYNAKEFVERWTRDRTDYGTEVVRQGVKTESVPLGELKNLSLEGMIRFHEQIISFAMSNSMVMEDTNGMRKLYKRRHEAKIDPVAAMMDAYVAWKLNKDMFN